MITFLVPESFRATVRNDHSISADISEITIKKTIITRLVSALIRHICCCFRFFFTLQDKHNIRTLSENVKFICTRCEIGQKSLTKACFSTACLQFVQINLIFSDNVRILSICKKNAK